MKVPFDMPELGISFSRFAAKDFELHCATWRDGANSHIYSVRVQHAPYAWTATLENDGREVGRELSDAAPTPENVAKAVDAVAARR